MHDVPKKGLTIKQINKAVFGDKKEVPNRQIKKTNTSKEIKPAHVFRKIQKNDMGVLLDLPYSFTQTVTKLLTPDWFDNNQKVDVSIIVPLYRSNIESLVDTWDFDNDGIRTEIIFVDDNCPNCSGEKVINFWQSKISEIKKPIGKIFKSHVTQGWGACCNIGAQYSSGNVLVFLEPECRLFPGWLSNLVKLVKRRDVALVGGLHVNEEEDTVWSAGMEWRWDHLDVLNIGRNTFKNQDISNPFSLSNVPFEIIEVCDRQILDSGLMAVKKNDFLKIGGFCPNLLSKKWSDADLCLSFLEQKKQILFQPNSRIYINPKKNKLKEKYEIQGKAYFCNKWTNTGRIDGLINQNRIEPLKRIERILIKRRAAFGDVLLAAAVAPALKEKFKEAQILFSTDCPEVLKNNPFIDKICSEFSERQFDLFINLDMAYEYRPCVNALQAFADASGVDVKKCKLYLETNELNFDIPKKYIVIHVPNNTWVGRNWSNIKFNQISSRLKKENWDIVCIGTECDYKVSYCDLDLRGKTSVGQLATIIKNCNLFVGTDSFPMHVAQTFDTPGVVFFGSILPETRLVGESILPVFADGIGCLGCHHRKPTPCVATNICEVGIQECVNGVSVDRMWKFIEQKLK